MKVDTGKIDLMGDADGSNPVESVFCRLHFNFAKQGAPTTDSHALISLFFKDGSTGIVDVGSSTRILLGCTDSNQLSCCVRLEFKEAHSGMAAQYKVIHLPETLQLYSLAGGLPWFLSRSWLIGVHESSVLFLLVSYKPIRLVSITRRNKYRSTSLLTLSFKHV